MQRGFLAAGVCDGLGSEAKIDPNLIVPDVTLSLRDGAIAPWSKTSAPNGRSPCGTMIQGVPCRVTAVQPSS